jgi:NAD(P)-dependent dehydrogenase (short-subunit alcohol dehydrogenase family)
MSGRLAGRTVIVTGASKGIGAATLAALQREGASVVGTARDVGGWRRLTLAGRSRTTWLLRLIGRG